MFRNTSQIYCSVNRLSELCEEITETALVIIDLPLADTTELEAELIYVETAAMESCAFTFNNGRATVILESVPASCASINIVAAALVLLNPDDIDRVTHVKADHLLLYTPAVCKCYGALNLGFCATAIGWLKRHVFEEETEVECLDAIVLDPRVFEIRAGSESFAEAMSRL